MPTQTASETKVPLALPIEVAELSHPHRHSKQMLHNPEASGRSYINNQPKATYVNWMNPFLWALIHSAAVAEGYPWSPAAIVKRLQLQYPELFAKLRPQRISEWRDLTVTDRLVWRPSVLANAQQGNHPGGAVVRWSILVSIHVAIIAYTSESGIIQTTGRASRGYLCCEDSFDATPSSWKST